MDLHEIKIKMQQMQDKSNAEFFAKISPTAKTVTGVKIPLLRKLAKEIIKGNVKDFLDNYEINSHEEFLLKGIAIAYSKLPLNEKFVYLEKFIPEIYDWSGCDIVIASFKFREEELNSVYNFIIRYKNSNSEYEIRFMIIMFFKFIREDYLEKIKIILEKGHFDKYYSQMAVAWLISAMFVKFRDYTLSYLNNNNLDNFTYNKALQKIRESNRVSKEDKALMKTIQRN